MYLPKICCSFCIGIDGHFMYQKAAQCLGRHTGMKGSFCFCQRSGQVRSGQVSVFNMHTQSKPL